MARSAISRTADAAQPAPVPVQGDSLDRDFQTFRQSRDPAALAAVFDAAAPRLLLVAMHLCRDAATAEDLVQTVFLQVLRDVDRFDARRPVLPWLLAMLEHRASDHRQRAHVRRERQANGDAPPFATSASPERAAVDAEVRERVAEALAGMPHDYRDVLTLRLVHGLSSVQIAHAQGLPPATVRTRLRRGLELLRGALPRGLATRGLLALLAAELVIARDGMAVVRTKVLAAAAAGTGATFAAGWWLTLAATFVLGAGSWWWFALDATTTVRSDGNAIAAVAANEASDGEQTRDRDSGATTTQPGPDRTAVADPRITTVRGRVVDATTGSPLAGGVATTHTHPVGGRPSEPDWRDPDRVTTGADGTFAVKFVPSRHRYAEVLFHTDGFVEEATSFEGPLRPGVDVEIGDVKLQPGTPVRLQLACDGKPLGGVETYASHAPDGERPNGVTGYGVSDADGFVDLGVCAPGTWWHDIRTAHIGHEARFDVLLQRAPLVVKVDLREPPRERSISGVLLDTRGAPVAGIDLGLRTPRGVWGATTRSDGAFLWTLAVPPPGSVREQIELPRNKRGELDWVDNGGDVTWGTHDVRLVVRRRAPAVLRIEVFDAATRQPVEAFGATCKAELGSCSAERRRVPVEPHDGGVATFDVAPGTWYASVFPEHPFAESAEIAVQVVEGQTTTLRVPLRAGAALDVDVVDAISGARLDGVELALAKAVPAQNARDVESSWYQWLREKPDMSGSGYNGTAVIVLARAVSGRDGRASLLAPPDLQGLVLVAGGPHCLASEHHGIVLPEGGAQTTIRVAPAAVVRGALTPRAFVERFGPNPERLAEEAARARTEWTDPDEFAEDYPLVVLRSANGASLQKHDVHVAADGTFVLGGVPAGRYTAHVSTVIGSCWTELGPFETVDVDPARTTPPLAIDVAALVPARGTVRFFVDGAPAAGSGGLARLIEGGTHPVAFPLDADGTATTPWLLPGTYVPFVLSGNDQVFGTERLLVSAGGQIDATFSLRRRTVTITVVEPNGDPARDVFLRTEAIDDPELTGARFRQWLPGRTDAAGHAVLIAPPGRLRLRAFARDQDVRDTDLQPALLLGEVAADANAATFRMPR